MTQISGLDNYMEVKKFSRDNVHRRKHEFGSESKVIITRQLVIQEACLREKSKLKF